ncbi:MAG: tRNA epoxyqueuosine(34) reductase QueG [Acidimicrobiales bacterium]
MSVAPCEIDPSALRRVGLDAGLSAVGITTADPFDDTRRELERRRAADLHGGMAFTYRNPARSTDPRATLPWARSIVVGALGYRRRPPDVPDGGPHGRVACYSWTDHYATLRLALTQVADHLREAGHRAVVLADDNALVDRAAAHRAGLGWFGKSSNLLLPGQGSWFVLGSVVTDADLPPAETPQPDGCGPCTRCLDACPTGAIVAPGVVDARRCLAWLVQATGSFPLEHRVALGDRIYGCDDCQEVCPPNRRSDRVDLVSTDHDDRSQLEAWVPLVEMLDADDADLLDRHGRWYVPQRDPSYLRRNALVALGNVADPDDARVAAALAGALAHADPLVRSHAVWAVRRLGLHSLLVAVADDPDPLVRDELQHDVPPRSPS